MFGLICFIEMKSSDNAIDNSIIRFGLSQMIFIEKLNVLPVAFKRWSSRQYLDITEAKMTTGGF